MEKKKMICPCPPFNHDEFAGWEFFSENSSVWPADDLLRDLLHRLASGDEDSAFEELYSRVIFPVKSLIAIIMQADEDTVYDIFVTTMNAVCDNVCNWKDGSPKAWISTIARNKAIDAIRKEKKLVLSGIEEDLDLVYTLETKKAAAEAKNQLALSDHSIKVASCTEDIAVENLSKVDLVHLINNLTHRENEVLNLTMAGAGNSEIHELLHISVDRIKKIKKQILRKLQHNEPLKTYLRNQGYKVPDPY